MKYLFAFFVFVFSYNTALAATFEMRDFLIQDVCVNAAGEVLPLSPNDDACVSTRNLNANEALPYNKHDQRGNNLDPAAAEGYQRSNSFPSQDGESVVQIFDFGVGGATFGTEDQHDGFNVYETKGTNASIVATKDGTGGLQFFLNPNCDADATSFSDINDSWLLAPNSVSTGITDGTTAELIIEKDIATCPSPRYDESRTLWEVPSSALTYANGDEMDSILSYHYSHKTVAESDHLEKFFFTDEFGPTRWERWERPDTPYHTGEKSRSETHAASETCNGPSESSDVTGAWYRVDCREWTHIIPITDAAAAPEDWAYAALGLDVIDNEKTDSTTESETDETQDETTIASSSLPIADTTEGEAETRTLQLQLITVLQQLLGLLALQRGS